MIISKMRANLHSQALFSKFFPALSSKSAHYFLKTTIIGLNSRPKAIHPTKLNKAGHPLPKLAVSHNSFI